MNGDRSRHSAPSRDFGALATRAGSLLVWKRELPASSSSSSPRLASCPPLVGAGNRGCGCCVWTRRLKADRLVRCIENGDLQLGVNRFAVVFPSDQLVKVNNTGWLCSVVAEVLLILRYRRYLAGRRVILRGRVVAGRGGVSSLVEEVASCCCWGEERPRLAGKLNRTERRLPCSPSNTRPDVVSRSPEDRRRLRCCCLGPGAGVLLESSVVLGLEVDVRCWSWSDEAPGRAVGPWVGAG